MAPLPYLLASSSDFASEPARGRPSPVSPPCQFGHLELTGFALTFSLYYYNLNFNQLIENKAVMIDQFSAAGKHVHMNQNPN